MANAYLGLVALREGHRESAIELMLMDKSEPNHVVFKLARELFDLGERESLIQLIGILKRKIKASARKRWLVQLANEEPPDFADDC
jgi:3,4-dihydroxy-2-butanone 4-phosphate synthase